MQAAKPAQIFGVVFQITGDAQRVTEEIAQWFRFLPGHKKLYVIYRTKPIRFNPLVLFWL